MEDQREVLLSLLNALERAHRKALPLLADPGLLDQELGQDALDVICMQFLAAGEALKRLDRLYSRPVAGEVPSDRLERGDGFP